MPDLTAEQVDGTVSIRLEDDVLARYNADTDASKPGFDVLAVPPGVDGAGGQNLIVSAPHDHSWHLGTFFCQKLVDGINCWESEAIAGGSGDQLYGYAAHEHARVREDDDRVTIDQTATWTSSTGKELLADDREITVHAPADATAEHAGYLLTWSSR